MRYQNAVDVLPQALIEQVYQYAQGLVYFPSRKPNAQHRNTVIRLARQKGMPVCQIAENHSLSKRRVYQILDQSKEAASCSLPN